jgi:hypothetical protein
MPGFKTSTCRVRDAPTSTSRCTQDINRNQIVLLYYEDYFSASAAIETRNAEILQISVVQRSRAIFTLG